MGLVVLPFACEAAVCYAVDVGAVVPPFWVCVTTAPIRTVLHRLSPSSGRWTRRNLRTVCVSPPP